MSLTEHPAALDDPHAGDPSATDPALKCYLSMLDTLAAGLAKACPAVGGPYRHRLSRLATRLAFDANSTAIEESGSTVEAEVKEYAAQASLYVLRRAAELSQTLARLKDLSSELSESQTSFAGQLRQLAQSVDHGSADGVALSNCIESMSQESQGLMRRLDNELNQVTERLKDAEITDPATGLMNRREMSRRIGQKRSQGETPTLLRFTMSHMLPDDAAFQVAARLASQLRFNDLTCRWSSNQFLVLFDGPADRGANRAKQIIPCIAGRYLLDSGATLELTAEAVLVEDPISE
jgi:GGDEF domain-containing protein